MKSGKVSYLKFFNKKTKKKYVPNFIYFSKKNFIHDSNKYLNLIKNKFKKKIIIRSSAIDEDTKNFSNAGKYSSEELEEQLLHNVIRESVEKELIAINKEAENEILNTKLEKINSAIEKRQSQLTRLDEDEDMKALTDKDKVKQIQKDIKTLEKAKAKIEKQLSKKDKVKKEVIDEDTPIDEAIDDKKLDDTTKSLEDIDKKVDDISKKTETMFESEGELPQNIINQAVEMFADVDGDTDEIINIASKFPEYEDAVVEFLEGYDLGLDYDI